MWFSDLLLSEKTLQRKREKSEDLMPCDEPTVNQQSPPLDLPC